LTGDAAIDVLTAITCAPISRTIRGISSEVVIGIDEGLNEECVISCDNIVTIPKSAVASGRVGTLSPRKRAQLDAALRYSLDIRY
jgi:mRNA interferase MazF